MTQTDFDVYLELREIVKQEANTQQGGDFVRFLKYCAARLNKGDSVQAIWNDFQKKAQ